PPASAPASRAWMWPMSANRWHSWPNFRWNPTSPSSPSWRPRCRYTGAAEAMTARRIASAILLAGFALMLAVNAPGQLSYDSVAQLADGRAGHYNSWHPPVMAFLL